MAPLIYYVGRDEERATALGRRLENVRVRQRRDPSDEPLAEWLVAPGVDGVVCEQALPGTFGLEVIDVATDVDPDLPAVLYPADGDEALAASAFTAGADEYVPRTDEGDELPELADRIATLVDEYRREGVESRIVDRLPGLAYRSGTGQGWPMQYVGGNCQALTGHPVDAFLSGEVSFEDDLVHPSDRDRVRQETDRQLDEGGRFELTYRIVTADGDTRWVWEQGYAVDDAETVVEGHIFDVTDRTQRKRELGLLTEAMNESSAGIVITDPDREGNPIVYANDGFLELTGYDREEVLGRNCRFLQGPDTDPRAIARMREAVDEREQVTVTVLNYRKDGTQFWNRVRIIPIRDEEGWLTNFVGFQQDVTGEVEQNRRLALLNRVLRHHVRNNMTHLLGGLELLGEETDPDRVDVDRLQNSGRELVELSERAREIEQLFGGERVYESRPLSELVGSVLEDVREEYEATIRADLPAIPVVVDDRMSVALRELLVNAIEHNGRQSPEVVVRALGRRSMDGNGVIRIAVADDGPPIPPADREVLAEGEESQLRHGSGLGLWMVHWLVTLSGGSVAVEDRDPRGNVVILELLVDE